MLTGIRGGLAALGLLLLSIPVWGATAEEPIYGGLGVLFGKPLPRDAYGSEIMAVPESHLPEGRTIRFAQMEPGATLPWRHFNAASLPRPLRKYASQNYVMLNDTGEVMRVISRTQYQGCGDEFDWLKSTLSRKYGVAGDAEIEAMEPYARALRVVFLNKQIEVRCGPVLVMDYMDIDLIRSWSSAQKARYALYQREQAVVEKRRMVLHRRQSIKFADSFTLGDQYRLEGAFGIQFQQPFAKNSAQHFPVDEPFIAMLPNLPLPFDSGEIQMVISPEKYPIVIRGTFHDVDFQQVAEALKAKYGTPMKASSRHIIHKVSGNHAIVKKLNATTIELAFIDTSAQKEQRRRLWDQESEGL